MRAILQPPLRPTRWGDDDQNACISVPGTLLEGCLQRRVLAIFLSADFDGESIQERTCGFGGLNRKFCAHCCGGIDGKYTYQRRCILGAPG
jgi:hypothetical protein